MQEPRILITLCASHISEINRLYNFENMLEGFKEQTLPTNMLISMSFESSLKDKIDYFIHKYNKNNIRIFKQNNCMSQFQHYKFLSEQFDTIFTNYTWCLFVDDDDYLNPTVRGTLK
jgi:hypothetical protein